MADVDERMTETMCAAFAAVHAVARDRDLAPRDAAFTLAVTNAAEAARLRGAI